MNLEDFLAPVRDSIANPQHKDWHPQSLASNLQVHLEVQGIPELDGIKMAIIGVIEDRGSLNNQGCKSAPDEVRRYLYSLYCGKWNVPIVDLGNLYPGETITDTYEGLREVCYLLLKEGITPIIIGGSQDITYGNYRAYDRLEQTVNLVSIDSRFDLGEQEQDLNEENFLSHVILKKPYILFNYSNIGYQTYFANQEEIDLMEKMYFDVNRLGYFKNNITETEPILRDADIVTFDLSAVRQPDAPGNLNASPNGFSGEEACAISRYSGISDKVSSFGIYGCNPSKDHNGQTSHLVAQMIWYFIEGYNSRKGDYPFASKNEYQRFTVLMDEGEHELVFYKSPLSDRWWIEVPMPAIGNTMHERHKLIPCSHSDYIRACENETPLRWWHAMKKAL
ncbi:formimidoylglutamase [Owenweeksia hongkongensis]|uniref:formimidoylglutamase n=1 Tax=Owenweeksia hongkongensis TaxID=253245 RepID=UPI003A8CB375